MEFCTLQGFKAAQDLTALANRWKGVDRACLDLTDLPPLLLTHPPSVLRFTPPPLSTSPTQQVKIWTAEFSSSFHAFFYIYPTYVILIQWLSTDQLSVNPTDPPDIPLCCSSSINSWLSVFSLSLKEPFSHGDRLTSSFMLPCRVQLLCFNKSMCFISVNCLIKQWLTSSVV